LSTIYPYIPEISVRIYMVRQFWFDQTENFRNKRNVLKDSPKFPTEISEWISAYHFQFFTATFEFSCHVFLVNNGLLRVKMVNGQSERNFPLGIFVYHLHKPLTNQFLLVNVKQSLFSFSDIGRPFIRSNGLGHSYICCLVHLWSRKWIRI